MDSERKGQGILWGGPNVDRREMISMLPLSLAAVSLASVVPASAALPAVRLRIAVVGAGIVGVMIAYHLARRGAAVTVLDPSPNSGCTPGAFAMLIAGQTSGSTEFNDLYVRAVADWRRFQAELGGDLRVQWGGTLNWTAPGGHVAKIRADMAKLANGGVAVERIEAEDIARLCPGAVAGPFGGGYFLPDQGAVDVDEVMAVVTAHAVRHGAVFRKAKVTGFGAQTSGGVQLLTDQGPVEAEKVVLAAGQHNTELAALVGAKVPLDLVSGTLAHSKPMPPILHRVLNGPLGSIKQDPNGCIVTGLDYAPGASGTDISDEYGARLLSTAAQTVPALRDAKLDRMTLGYVPIPAQDRMPIVGRVASLPNVYLASMMSGVTMAPLMARLITTELLDDVRIEMLASFRPERFNPQWQGHG